MKKLNGASQGTFNQSSQANINMLYPFLNRPFVITGNYQRLKIIQLLTGLPITSGHFYFFTEKHLQWLIPMKA